MLTADIKKRLRVGPSTPALHSPQKEAMRQEIAQHTAAFLRGGGHIHRVGSEANASQRFDGLRVGITINPERQTRDIRPAITPPVGRTGLRGVRQVKNGKFVVRYKNQHLGTCDTQEEASALYKAAAAQHKNKNQEATCTN